MFGGTIKRPNRLLQGPILDIPDFYAEAARAEAHVPTPENIEINMFIDGSYTGFNNQGGFAVVFKQFVQDSTAEQEIVQIAFQMLPGISCIEAEACAVAESLVRARRQVVETVKALGAATPESPILQRIIQNPVLVTIFTDNCRNLEFFDNPDWEMPRPVSLTKIIDLCFLESHNVLVVPEYPGLVVKLKLAWVPAHRAGYEVRLHVMADRAAVEARRKGSFEKIGYDRTDLSHRNSVYGPLQSFFIADAALPPAPHPRSRKRGRDDPDLDPETDGTSDTVEPAQKKRKFAPIHLTGSRSSRRREGARAGDVAWDPALQGAPFISDGIGLYLTREGLERYPRDRGALEELEENGRGSNRIASICAVQQGAAEQGAFGQELARSESWALVLWKQSPYAEV